MIRQLWHRHKQLVQHHQHKHQHYHCQRCLSVSSLGGGYENGRGSSSNNDNYEKGDDIDGDSRRRRSGRMKSENEKVLNSSSSFTTRLSNSFREYMDTGSSSIDGRSTKTSIYKLPALVQSMSGLYKLRHDSHVNSDQDKIYLAAKELLRRLRIGIKNGLISVNRDSHTISNLVSDALVLYGDNKSSSSNSSEKIKDSAQMLRYMKRSLRLDLTPNHFAGAIRVACVEENWKAASTLFLSQIDDFAGMVPMNVRGEALELGLYAVARSKKDDPTVTDDSLSSEVFDIARCLAIVSPMDLDGYMIAAIKALGQIGEWRATTEFLKSNESMGGPLILAVMDACLKSYQYEEALTIYNKNISLDYESTGMFDQNVHDVRNSAFQAYGQAPAGKSNDAIRLFQSIRRSDHNFSIDAVHGLIRACARDDDWMNCIYVVEYFLSRHTKNASFNIYDPEILSILINALNSAGKENISLLYACMFNNAYKKDEVRDAIKIPSYSFSLPTMDENNLRVPKSLDEEQNCKNVESSLLRNFYQISEICFANLIKTLYNTGAINRAMYLYEVFALHNDMVQFETANSLYSRLMRESTNRVFDDFATITLEVELEKFHDHFGIFANFQSTENVNNLLIQLASSLDFDDVGLLIASRLTGLNLIQSPHKLPSDCLVDDDTLYAYMKILHRSGKINEALDVYFSKVDDSSLLSVYDWKQSLHFCFALLIESQRSGEIWKVVNQMNFSSVQIHDLEIATDALLQSYLFQEVIDVFTLGARKTNISECLLTNVLLAISNRDVNKKKELYPKVINAFEESNGIDPGNWVKSNKTFIALTCPSEDWKHIFGWPSVKVRRQQFQLAYSTFREFSDNQDSARNGVSVLCTLANIAGYEQRHLKCRGKPKQDITTGAKSRKQLRERRIGIDVIGEIMTYAKNTEMELSPQLMLSVIMALRALKGNKEAIPIIREYISGETFTDTEAKTQEKILLHCIAVANDVGNNRLQRELTSLLLEMGVDYIISETK